MNAPVRKRKRKREEERDKKEKEEGRDDRAPRNRVITGLLALDAAPFARH